MTAPPFCAMPSWSSTVTPLPSMCAAVPMMAPMVTTPVPPMPVISTPYGLSASDGSRGAGGSGGSAVATPAFLLSALPLRTPPPSIVTKLGQKPLRQEKSLLQDDWSMARLLPNSVSTGTTLRQFDCVEQSPQPSHTAWLMYTRLAGSG